MSCGHTGRCCFGRNILLRQQVSPKHWYLPTTPHGVITQNTNTDMQHSDSHLCIIFPRTDSDQFKFSTYNPKVWLPRTVLHPDLYYSSIHEAVGREWCYRTPPMWTPHLRDPYRGPSASCPPHRSVWGADTPAQPEPDYLPMSPSPARVVAEEQHYTVMASVNTT
jgi:hypothetical protein